MTTVFETLLKEKYQIPLSYFPEALPVFNDSYKGFFSELKKTGWDGNFSLFKFLPIQTKRFILEKFLTGWLKSNPILKERGISPNFETLSFLEFVSVFHSQRNVRLVFDKLRRKLDINVTAVCNYSCPYCYQRSRDGNWQKNAKQVFQKELKIDDFSRIIKEASILGAKYLKITGGEPLTKDGIIDLIKFSLTQSSYEEVELLSNCSLVEEYKFHLKKAIEGNERRFHLHTSIDGIDKHHQNDKLSLGHLKKIEQCLKFFSGIKISVNSMWTKALLDEKILKRIYLLLKDNEITRWTISFPYLVSDLKEAVLRDSSYIPDYKSVIEIAKKLIVFHQQNNFPFQLSLPLIFKHELFDRGFSVSPHCFDNHPCFPCHGSYFIIGPQGEIWDCLLAGSGKVKTDLLGKDSLFQGMLKSIKNNEFYSLTSEKVSLKCRNCRYINFCQGQCPNDRVSNSNFHFQKSTRYERDKSACSLLSFSEKEIWPVLNPSQREKISRYLKKDGFYPETFNNVFEIIS